MEGVFVSQQRILITDLDLGDTNLERELVSRHLDAELVVRECRTEADVLDAVHESHPVAIITQWAPVTGAVMDAAPGCRVISRVGIGLDMIDLEAAAARGIPVKNVPHYCIEEVAMHAVAMGFSLWRHLPALDASLRGGEWDAASWAPLVKLLSDSTIGLVGMGRIGRIVADAYAQWGATVLVHDPVKGEDPFERVDLVELTRRSDLITLHAPLTAKTHHLIDASMLDSAEQAPIVVNVSRGGLVDTAALASALAQGQVSAAGLDVFESEPLSIDDPIRSAPNTIITPHAAWCSAAALPALRQGAVMNVVEVLTRSRS